MKYKKININGCVGTWLLLLCLFMTNNVLFAQKVTLISGINTEEWVNKNFAKGKIPPFSFVYGGKNSGNFIQNWLFESLQKTSSIDKDEYIFIYH